jgi:hypothetical protein
MVHLPPVPLRARGGNAAPIQGELFPRLPRQLPTFRDDPSDDYLLSGYQLIPGDRHPR